MLFRKSNKAAKETASAAPAPAAPAPVAKQTRAEKRAAKKAAKGAAKQAAAAAPAPAKQTRAERRAAKQAAKRAAASRPGRPGAAYRRPQPDLYTLLLTMALLAIVIAIVFLCMEMSLYEFQFKNGPPVAMMAAWRAAFGSSCIAFLSL